MELGSADVDSSPAWRYWAVVAALALLLGGVALWGANKQTAGLFHDDGIYAVVGKSLAEGQGYRIISLPGSPAQTKYPFLYSYLLSWLWSLDGDFPHNIFLLKALNAAILAALFFAAVFFYRGNFSDGRVGAAVFGLLLCTNPVVFTLTDYLLSDLLAVLFAVLALGLASVDAQPGAPRRAWLPLGIVAGLSCLNRLAAAPLVLAGAAHHFFKGRWRDAALVVGAALALLAPWWLWVARAPRQASGSLFDYYAAYSFTGSGSAWSLERQWNFVAGNAGYLVDSIDLIFLLPLLPDFAPALLLFTAIGACLSLRRDQLFLWSFFLSSLALLLIWPFHPNRYTAPLVAVLLFFLFRGVRESRRWIGRLAFGPSLRRIFSGVVALPIALLVVLNGIWLSSYLLNTDGQSMRGFYGNRLKYGWAGFEESFAWVRRNTAADSVLGTAYDPMYFLYTGRKAIRPALHRPWTYFYPYGAPNPDVGAAAEIRQQIVQLGVRYLIIDPMDGYAEGHATLGLFRDIVKSHGEQAKLMFTSSDGRHLIYRLDPK